MKTIIIDNEDEAERISEEIRNKYFGIIGFDTETTLYQNRRSGPIDIIQIYLEVPLETAKTWSHLSRYNISHSRVKLCYIFHIAKFSCSLMNKTIPPSLAKIIRSKKHMKAISAPENDVKWLYDDFGITMAGYIDIQTFAIQMGEQKTGLDSLASKFLVDWVPKNKNVCKMNWKGTLTKDMIHYASHDAYASYKIFVSMFPTLFSQRALQT